MKYIWAAVAVALIAYAAYEYVRIHNLIKVSAGLVAKAEAYQSNDGFSILVLGDSTAVGVGATSSATVAGRLGAYLHASVENHAKSGAVTADLAGQIAQAQKSHYDLVLMQIGANDIIQFNSLKQANAQLDAALASLQPKSDRIVLLTAGRVGEAPLFPKLFGWIWTWRAARLRGYFIPTLSKYNAAYVDLYSIPDPFSADPARYYAPDGLHLTDQGYGFWFEQTQKVIDTKWPDLAHAQ